MTNELVQQVAQYYYEHSVELTAEKRFHFASRMVLWVGDERAKQLLQGCRSAIVPTAETPTSFMRLFQHLRDTPLPEPSHIIAYTKRLPYFEQYAPLYGMGLALFRLHHLDAAYDINAREAFKQAIPLDDLLARERQLLQDPTALRTLSTYAINFLYLLRRELLHDDDALDSTLFYELGDTYNTDDSEQLRLLIYLYTHCIIGESNFYVRPIPLARLPVCRAMLIRLDMLIEQNFAAISLDTKLEYLVCCRLCAHQSPLTDQIYDECERSMSPEGSFLIDTHNTFSAATHKRNFAASEHRNVLFIMSTSPFTPTK